MLLLLQGLIPKKPDEDEGNEKEEDEFLDDEDTNSSDDEGVEGTENNYLKPDNLLYFIPYYMSSL